jgi:hypothetical protein
MLSPGETQPGGDARDGTDQLFRALSRLVPNSGIQFLDFSIPRHIVDGVTRHFAQEKIRVGEATVWALAAAPPAPAASDEALDATLALRVHGRAAVSAVLDRWIPLPFLRFVARDGSGRARFDDGPYNWARVFIATPGADDDPAFFQAVAAFDTRTEQQSRVDLSAYLMPTSDDVQFSSTFALTDDATDLAFYLAEDWVQDWVAAAFPVLQPASRESAPHTSGLQQVASYLTLLTVLRRASVLPSFQFFDMRPDVVAPVPVDVVMDIGTSRSAALLVESDGGRPQIADGYLLSLRDLAHPTRRYRGAFESRIAFGRNAFGLDALSRKSGRSDAFHWPSLARVGPEAVRLATQSRASDGATGVAQPKSHLRDLTLREDTWRFAAEPQARAARSQMISGRMLSHAPQAVAGLLTGPTGATKHVAMRPRYALSSMTSFFMAEVVMQALSQINAPALAGETGRPEVVRQLRQIILTAPLTMPLDERDLLRERAEDAIDMVWKALDWEDAAASAPSKPVVRLGLDETLSAQLVFLFDEIAHRFSGDPRAFLDVMGKSRPEFGVQPCIRLGALDVGGGHTTMTIVTYASSADAPISPRLLGAQRSHLAGGAVLDHLAAALLLPTLADAIAEAGGENPLRFLEQLIEPPTAGSRYDPAALGTRLSDLCLKPAALTLLQMAAGLSPQVGPQVLTVTFGELLAAQGGLNASLSDELSVALEAIRATPLDLAAVALSVRLSDVAAAARTALEPMITSLARALVTSDCDAILLTGWAARLPLVKDLLLEHMPWRPDRIIPLNDHAWQAWYPMTTADRGAADGKDVALIGALLALAGGERLGFGSGESGFPFGGSGLGDADGDSEAWQAATARGAAS